MKVVFIASEVTPFAKTGGLADVVGTLTYALGEKNIETHVFLPKYKNLKSERSTVSLHENVTVHFIANSRLYHRSGYYGWGSHPYKDNLQRFYYLCEKTLKKLKALRIKPDILHCNDWHTALIPVLLKTKFKNDPFYAKTKVIFSIHNLSYKGTFTPEQVEKAAVKSYFAELGLLESHGGINLLKSALGTSDLISTVSPNYAKEIQTKEFGCHLDEILRLECDKIRGILNGLDYQIWNPETDPVLEKNYSVATLSFRQENKRALQEHFGFEQNNEIPLIGIVSRLTPQKGVDLIIQLIKHHKKKPMQFVILGKGDKKLQEKLKQLSLSKNHNLFVRFVFDDQLAHKIYSGSDIFLMPSKFEPCGLGQIISLRYGTIPVVRKTGGLADTIIDLDEDKKHGNGFVFMEYSYQAFEEAFHRALKVFENKEKWEQLQKNAMQCDFSWEHSARDYINLYKEVIASKNE